jgi:tetratricopeptide (TPR) repeat protein
MLSLTTRTDVHGNPVTGAQSAVDRYDVAIDHLLAYREDLLDSMTSLVTDEPDFAMGLVLAAYMSLTSTDAHDLDGARQLTAHLDTLALNDRETAHRAAIGAWSSGDWHGAARRLDALLVRWPADLLGLLVGHQLDFFLGDAANLRDRVGRSLPAIDQAHPHHAYARAMYAFGLEESGNYELAEHHALAALERNSDDVWATHAATHVYEMQGRVDEGIRFLRSREDDWGSNNLFAVHNWWHLALYLLEAGDSDESLAIYDRSIHNERSAGVPLEMLDASALLWRLHLDGFDVGGRFGPLADGWATRTAHEPWYVFNDLHAVMALAGAGRLADAGAVIDRLAAYVSVGPPSSNVRMTAEVGLPACRSVLAHVEGRHADVVAELMPIRTILARFGGSHAQRDALQRTLVVSAIRSGQLDLATSLVNERLGVRETSVWSWRRRSQVLGAAGDSDDADRAEQRAAFHAARFAAAAAARPATRPDTT